MQLVTDGTVSDVTGVVDIARWPEQIYQREVAHPVPARCASIFFAGNNVQPARRGRLHRHVPPVQGRPRAEGLFYSDEAGAQPVSASPNLEGDLIWVPERIEVTRATSGFYGGQTAFTYRMAPLGKPAEPIRSRFDVEYTDVDLLALTNLLETEGLRVAGRATGRNLAGLAERPVGPARRRRRRSRWCAARRESAVLGPRLPAGRRGRGRGPRARSRARSATTRPLAAGRHRRTHDLSLRSARRSGSSRARSPPAETYVAFEGATAWGDRSKIPVPRDQHELAGERSPARRAS